jgi:hypothetical protein
MNFRLFSFSLLFVPALLPFAPSFTPKAQAMCVEVDVSTQTAIHGSKQPAQQTNNVNQQSQGSCYGNTIVHTSTQTAVTPGTVTQTRTSNEQISGGVNNGTGVNGKTIKIPVSVQTDVYSPGLDPDFLARVRGSYVPHN